MDVLIAIKWQQDRADLSSIKDQFMLRGVLLNVNIAIARVHIYGNFSTIAFIYIGELQQ